MSKSRNYVFTFNNYDGLPDLDHEFIRYGIYQEEIGEEGTVHLQGYIELTKPMRITAVTQLNNQALLGARLASRRGSQKQAIDYCKKRDDTYIAGPYEFGTPARQGERQDIINFKDDIIRGASSKELITEHTLEYFKYHKIIPHVRQLFKKQDPPIDPDSFNIPLLPIPKDRCMLFYGPSTLGKTEYAKAHFKNPLFVKKIEQLRELEPEHDGIVFDDMSFKHMPAEERLAILERRNPTCIHARYSNIPLDPYPPRIFTHNNNDIFFGPQDTEAQTCAIQNRLDVYPFSERLFD